MQIVQLIKKDKKQHNLDQWALERENEDLFFFWTSFHYQGPTAGLLLLPVSNRVLIKMVLCSFCFIHSIPTFALLHVGPMHDSTGAALKANLSNSCHTWHTLYLFLPPPMAGSANQPHHPFPLSPAQPSNLSCTALCAPSATQFDADSDRDFWLFRVFHDPCSQHGLVSGKAMTGGGFSFSAPLASSLMTY